MLTRCPAVLTLSLAAVLTVAGCDRPAPHADTTPTDAAPAATGTADSVAARLAAQTFEAMGGNAPVADTRYLRYDFIVSADGKERNVGRHLWDRQTNDYRVEGKLKTGEPYVVLFNLDRRDSGLVTVAGAPAADSLRRSLLDRAYARYVNDGYWLLMPLKLRDPGVTLTAEPDTTFDGQTYHTLHLSFTGVGLTPGDQYWAYLNPETHLMDRWAMRLEDYQPTDSTTHFAWTNYHRVGALTLSDRKVNLTRPGAEIRYGSLASPQTVPDGVFTDPTVPMP